MSKLVGTTAVTLLLLSAASAAQARPPTFLFSPGYQNRLAESRKAYADAWYAQQYRAPTTPAPRRKKPHTR